MVTGSSSITLNLKTSGWKLRVSRIKEDMVELFISVWQIYLCASHKVEMDELLNQLMNLETFKIRGL